MPAGGGVGLGSKEVFNLFTETKKELENMIAKANSYTAELMRNNRNLVNDEIEKKFGVL